MVPKTHINRCTEQPQRAGEHTKHHLTQSVYRSLLVCAGNAHVPKRLQLFLRFDQTNEAVTSSTFLPVYPQPPPTLAVNAFSHFEVSVVVLRVYKCSVPRCPWLLWGATSGIWCQFTDAVWDQWVGGGDADRHKGNLASHLTDSLTKEYINK